ncbi:UDP-N-acetylmuramoyl-L-alanine--D-glutamate ligase [bacterium]|nr:UDP-N-acetylmuramoyl-L-alanine--D-glutamate ligase [bacterium]
MNDFEGKRITVMGLGLLGGGVAVTRFLASQGARVTVTDMKDAGTLADSVAALDGLPVTLRLGEHVDADFTETDLIVVNPAVADSSPFLAKARAAGVTLTTEINLFFRLCPAPIVAVTGSNGKSTTVSLLHHLLQADGRRAWLGGNIGRSLLEDLDDISPDDVVALELSSFQLERLGPTGMGPAVAVALNCTPNHLDRHGTFENYAQAKQQILANQGPDGLALLNADCPVVSAWSAIGRSTKLSFGLCPPLGGGAWLEGDAAVWHRDGRREALFVRSDVPLPGRHNLSNALAAAGAAVLCGAPAAGLAERMRSFRGLEHRLERVRTVDGVDYYNDSKATTPEAAVVALEAFDRPIVLIAGGYDKHVPLDAMAEAMAGRCRACVLIGQTADALSRAIAACSAVPVRVEADFPSAVAAARSLAAPGDVALLSPGCASFGMFQNFEQRGALFKTLVSEMEPC